MKDHAFSETTYGINGDQDWNNCLNMQQPNPKNRTNAQTYLKKTDTMGPWGSYSFAQLSDAVKATTGNTIP